MASEAVAATKTGGTDKLRSAAEEINAAIAALEPLGFAFPEVCVTLSLIPGIKVTIDRARVVAGSDLDEVARKLENRPVASALIKAIATADKISTSIPLPGRRVTQYEVELSVPPTVCLIYQKS